MQDLQEIFDYHFWANVRTMHNAHEGADFDNKPPRVGPFWFIETDGVFIFADETVSVLNSDKYENLQKPDCLPNRGRKVDHASLWSKVCKKFPSLEGKKFYEVPRGRIILKEYEDYIVFLSRKYVDNGVLREDIIKFFNLPRESTKFIVSPEYKI